jgi:hypothetical protein
MGGKFSSAKPMFVAVAVIVSAILVAAPVSADDTDTQFVGEVSFFLRGTYLDPATIKSLVADAKKVCAMSDAGFSDEAMMFAESKWHPSDPFGFMGAATRAYCPGHLSDWSGL